jgi:hypothetical protein
MVDAINTPYIDKLPSSHPKISEKLPVKPLLYSEAGYRVVSPHHLVVGADVQQAMSKGDSQSSEEEQICKDQREDQMIDCRE